MAGTKKAMCELRPILWPASHGNRRPRVAFQYRLTPEEYTEAMSAELEQLDEERVSTLTALKANQKKVARSYNKKVRNRKFVEGDFEWKLVQPRVHDRGMVNFLPTGRGLSGCER